MKHFDCTVREIYHNGEIHSQIQCNYHDLRLFFHQSGTDLGWIITSTSRKGLHKHHISHKKLEFFSE